VVEPSSPDPAVSQATGASCSPGDASPAHTKPIALPHATLPSATHDAELAATQQYVLASPLHASLGSASAGDVGPAHEKPSPGYAHDAKTVAVQALKYCPYGRQQNDVPETPLRPALHTRFASPSSGRSLVQV
jgi:hypothetical protein